jgi:hypothetical protein
MADTKFHPDNLVNWDVTEIIEKTNLYITDASVVRLAFILKKQHPHHNFKGKDEEKKTHIRDINFAERALVSRNSDGSVDLSETLLSSAGPYRTIGVEQNIHSILTIPETLILSGTASELYYILVEESSSEDDLIPFIRFIFLSLLLYVTSISFVLSIIHTIICSFSKLTDRSAAHYLTLPLTVRFLDAIMFVSMFIFISPINLVLHTSKIYKDEGDYKYLIVIVFTTALFIVIVSFLSFYFIYREHGAFDPFPEHLNIEAPLHTVGARPVPIDKDGNPIEEVKYCTTLINLFCKMKSFFDKLMMKTHIFNANSHSEYRNMNYIGRWRKYTMSRATRIDAVRFCGGELVFTCEEDPKPDNITNFNQLGVGGISSPVVHLPPAITPEVYNYTYTQR